MLHLLSLKRKRLLHVLAESFKRLNLTFQLYFKLIRLLFVEGKVPQANKPFAAHFVIVATDFLPSIHGGIYRPLSWLRFSSQHRLNLQMITNKPKRTNDVGLSMFAELELAEQINYCDENEFNLFSRPARMWLSRPEFLLAALKCLEEMHKKQAISHLIATGPDFSSFVIAALFAHKHKIRLHLDYRDEWTQSPFEFSQPTNLARYLEKACIKLADSISMTTQSQLNYFKQHFGDDTPLYLKYNGCDNFPLLETSSAASTNEIRLCHSGSIGGHNSLGQVLFLFNMIGPLVLASEQQLHLTFCGSIADNQLSLLSADANFKVTTLGQLTPEQAFIHTAQTDICLLLIDERYQRYLPGKLFGYIATGNPILIIGAAESTEIEALCNEYQVPHFFADHNSANTMACAQFIINARKLNTPPEQLLRFRANMDRQKLAKEFFDIFQYDNAKI